ncbi:MAG: hypothetical protein QXU32_06590 [Nitrososphaerales archaeon]
MKSCEAPLTFKVASTTKSDSGYNDRDKTVKQIRGSRQVKVEFIIGIDSIWKDQEGLHIAGVLSIPRASLNGWIYLPEELALQDGKSVPMFFEHEEIFDPNAVPIGRMNVYWNQDLMQLNYEAIVTDKEKIALIDKGEYRHVSMGATWEDFDLIRGWLFPRGTEIVEGSLVKFPGIPESSVNIIDHVRREENELKIKTLKQDEANAAACHKKLQLIPTVKCDSDFCYSIFGSRKAARVKSAACDKGMDKEENEEENENEKEKEKENEKIESTSNTDPVADKINAVKENRASDYDKIKSTALGTNGPIQKTKYVMLDANAMKLLLKENSMMVIDAMGAIVSPLQKIIGYMSGPQPTAMVSDGALSEDVVWKKFYQVMDRALKRMPNSNQKSLDWDFVISELRKEGIAPDAITTTSVGAGLGKFWKENISVIPAGLAAGVRNTCEVVTIERGAEEAIFTLVDTPDPVDGVEATASSDATQTITTVTAKPIEKLITQTVSDQAIRKTPTNLAESLALSYRNRELLDEDEVVLNELNTISVGNLAGSFFGGNATAENQIDSGDTFTHDLLAKAKRSVARKGWRQALVPGQLVCVMSPEQHEQLITDTGMSRFVETTSEGRQLREGLLERVHGVDILVSSKVPTGSGSGTPAVTTHRAFLYLRQIAVGLAFTKEMAIETDRDINKRATNIVASWERAAKVKTATAVARIVTYGSG